MNRDFILTQVKEVVMTSEKTVTVVNEKLETIDILGRKQLVKSDCTEDVVYHRTLPDIGRAA